VLIAYALAWAIAQVLKLVIHLTRSRKLDFRYLVTTGGMPSAHSASSAALATAVGLQEGWNSAAFVIALAFALVVMFDAQGVRRAASMQARILNQILDELFAGQPLSERRLKELLGHTPVQVFVGAGLGVVVTWLWMGR
jgi:acid phosphatase family membrane protein YuiD